MDMFGVTDIGCVRQHNDDCIHWQDLPDERGYLAVLADGMGGYGGGALASQMAVDNFTQCLVTSLQGQQTPGRDMMLQLLTEAGAFANKTVRQERHQHPEFRKMGTTLIAMVVMDQQYWLAHVGDSRCYCANQRGLQVMTQDHSLVQELLDNGSLTEKEAERAPFRNMLTRAVGPERNVQFSCARYPVQPGDAWLLCSDGLYNSLPESTIDHWMQAGLSAQETATTLVRESIRHNAQDNVSVIVLKQEPKTGRKDNGDSGAAGR